MAIRIIVLIISLFLPSVALATTTTYTSATQNSNFIGYNTAFDTSQSYNLVGYSATPTYNKSGIRITGVTVAYQATIVSCTLVVQMGGTNPSLTVDLKLYGNLATDAAAFTTEAQFDTRTLTTAYATFSIGAHTEDEIRRISVNPDWLQEIVCQAGYSGGANTEIALMIFNNGSTSGETKSIVTNAWGDPPAAKLVVVYTNDGLGCAAVTDTLASCQIDSLKNDMVSTENDSIKLVWTTKSTADIDSTLMCWSAGTTYPDSSAALRYNDATYTPSTTDSTKIYIELTETDSLLVSFWNVDAGIYSLRQQRSRIFTAAAPPSAKLPPVYK